MSSVARAARHDPETSDASLRAALENERANAEHLRRLSEQQKVLLRRRLVRLALIVDRRVRVLSDTVDIRRRRVTRRALKAGLILRSLQDRHSLPARRADLAEVLDELPAAPVVTRTISVIIVADAPVPEAPPIADGLDVELVVVRWGRKASGPPGREVVLVDGQHKSFTAAAAAGASASTGSILCFLATTSQPLDPTWLARLTAVIGDFTIAATPMLVHPERSLREATPHDLLVRELGLDLVATEGCRPEVRANEAGTHPRPEQITRVVGAGSAPCFVVDRQAFFEAGGLGPIEDFDAAIVDLCGRLRAGGGCVVAVPSAVVADHRPVRSVRSLTQPIDATSPGWRAVVDRQGPTLLRLARGFRVTDHLRIALTVGAPSARAASQWGDWHLAQALARGLRRLGHSVHLQTADQANDPAGRSCDVHVVLRGMVAVTRTPGQRHVLWIISHPESIDIQECHEADLVLVASERFAADLRGRTDTPVEVLLQATDDRRFKPLPPDPEHTHAVAVVATTRHVFRPSVALAISAGLRPAIYGTGWEEFVDKDLIVADFMPNEQLPRLYSSVGVLLNDHWDTMRAWGFVSNRLFDALACGTPIVSDHLPEISELFGDAVAMYRDADDLRREVEFALDEPVEARRRAAAGRQIVLDGHTFDHRAATFLDALERHGLDRAPR